MDNMVRFIKFVLIAAPFVVIYFFSLLYVVATGLTETETTNSLAPVLAAVTAVFSVLVVTWASGFWGRWWFPVLFGLAPLIIFADFLVAATLGVRPMAITITCVIVLSVYGSVRARAGNKA